MPYRTLFTVASPEGDDALDAAIACARAWSAHLDVICVSAIQFAPPVMVLADMPVAGPGLVDEALAELDRTEALVRDRLGREDFPWSVNSCAEPVAEVARQVTAAARFADLALLPRLERGDGVPFQTLLETMIHTGRVPLMVVPGDLPAAPERAMLAWDGSDVALVAARAALPLLETAQSVEIVSVDPDAAMSAGARDLAVMLDRHGISAHVTELPRRGRRVAEVLASHARESGAEVSVMGAYGTGRLREILLGGVTRAMLEGAPGPLLLAR